MSSGDVVIRWRVAEEREEEEWAQIYMISAYIRKEEGSRRQDSTKKVACSYLDKSLKSINMSIITKYSYLYSSISRKFLKFMI